MELLPLDELARRFDLSRVAHSAGVFDEDKLAWANRHYLKQASVARLVDLAEPYLRVRAMVIGTLSAAGREWLERVLPPLATSLDRLSQIPDRLRTVFDFDATASLGRDDIRREFETEAPRQVVAALAEDLATSARLVDRDTFRAVAGRVRERTGQKGRALLHPIRVALTGELEGPELDLIVPAIDRAVELSPADGLQAVTGCRERAAAFAKVLLMGYL